MKRHHHERPHDGEIETAEPRLLAEEVRYLRHLIRSVGRQVRGLDPELLAAWKTEVKASRREIGYLDEADNPLDPEA